MLLKCGERISSNLSSWGVMSNEEENDAVLHLLLNILRDYDVESVVAVSP